MCFLTDTLGFSRVELGFTSVELDFTRVEVGLTRVELGFTMVSQCVFKQTCLVFRGLNWVL